MVEQLERKIEDIRHQIKELSLELYALQSKREEEYRKRKQDVPPQTKEEMVRHILNGVSR